MRTIFQWLRWVCLLLLGLAWTKTSSFAAVGALNQANGGLTIRYDATETQNRGYDAEPSRAWDNNPPEMVDASAFFGSPAQFNAAKGLGNPFKGKTPTQIDEMFKAKGFEPRGPDPLSGKGGYVNPKTGRSYHIDEANSFGEAPHVDVNRLKTYDGPLEKKKYFTGE